MVKHTFVNMSNFIWKFLSLYLSLLVKVKCDELPPLEWPEQYSFQLTRYSTKSDIIEIIKYWRDENNTKIEYNNGAVESFVLSQIDDDDDEISYKHYELHPETKEGGVIEKVCEALNDSNELEDIMPWFNDVTFTQEGYENVRGKDCVKFYADEEDTYKEKKEKHYLWAVYDKNHENWRPVRYEYQNFNTWRGSLEVRDIWDFDNFETDFDTYETFLLPEACSEEESLITHTKNDDSVTKHLKFMNHHKKQHVDHVFNAFKTKHGRNYENDTEHDMRKQIFQERMRLIRETNLQNLGYKLAINHLADRTADELKKYKGLNQRDPEEKATHPFPYKAKRLKDIINDLPKEYDARTEGLVAPVQNQGKCGSCWAFGATAVAEGALARQQGSLVRLAPQALIDCSWESRNHGCDGGTDKKAFKWMMKYGMPTIFDYGIYEEQDGYCHISNVSNIYKYRGFVAVTPYSVGALKVAVTQNGPVAVSVHASDAFLFYSSGIFYDTKCKSDSFSLDHVVTLVGYGEEYGETFWILKNTYGPEWGISGYMHILAKKNNCGVMTEPTYVLI